MRHQFTEIKLGPDFAKDKVKQIKELVDKNIPFTIAGMPGVGVSTFLRYLTTKDFAHFVYVDTFNLHSLSKLELFKELLKQLGGNATGNESQILEACRARIQVLSKDSRVVIIFNRFDNLKKEFNNRLFSNIRSLRMVCPDKIITILTANKPYFEIVPVDITSDNFHILNKTYYFKPYNIEDLEKLLIITAKISHSKSFVEKSLKLSSGHYQLLQLFLKSEFLENPLMDRFIKYQLKELLDSLDYSQRKKLQNLGFGKHQVSVDPYLLDIGLVVKSGKSYRLFTPLLEEYIQKNSSLRLPKKESKLFKLLLRNIESVVSKEIIFETVWQDNPEEASDWALNSLIYRLRKNSGFASNGYIIENHKKEGFILYKI